MPFARKICISLSSVPLLPCERMAAMTAERFRWVKMSGMAQPFRANQVLAARRTKSSGDTAFTGDRRKSAVLRVTM